MPSRSSSMSHRERERVVEAFLVVMQQLDWCRRQKTAEKIKRRLPEEYEMLCNSCSPDFLRDGYNLPVVQLQKVIVMGDTSNWAEFKQPLSPSKRWRQLRLEAFGFEVKRRRT